MIGRRVTLADDEGVLGALKEPGDYCGPIYGYSNDRPAVFFLLPNARAGDRHGTIAHVTAPPHSFRECADGSLEIRESILVHGRDGEPAVWHGYLDEGHSWRTV